MNLILSLVLSLSSFGNLYERHLEEREHTFRTKQGSFTIKTKASTLEESFELAAYKCSDHLERKYGADTEQKRMDIIDVCANPVR